MSVNRRELGAPALIILAGVCACVLMYWVMAWGIGVSPDSLRYIGAARNLLAGNGLYFEGKPLAHFPPVYPFLLAFVGLFQHGDVLQAGRLLGATLFGANLVLFAFAVRICTERSVSATVCAILFFLCSAAVMDIHTMAWSEPPFITFSLAALVLLSFAIVRPKVYLLLAAALMAGFAIATRYVGGVLLPPMVLAIFLFGDRPAKRKVRDAAAFTAVALLPIAASTIRNVLVAQSATDRGFAIHPFAPNQAEWLLNTMHDFVLPVGAPGWTKAVVPGVIAVLLFVALFLLHRRDRVRRDAPSVGAALRMLCLGLFLTYIPCLVLSISFVDSRTPLDMRILLPALLPLAAAGIALAWSVSRAPNQRLVWYGFLLFALLSVSANGRLAVSQAADIHRNGRWYNSRYWQTSETLSCLAGLRDIRTLYVNDADETSLLTDKKAIGVPVKLLARANRANKDYREQMRQMCAECREGRALIAYMDGVMWRWARPDLYLPSREEIESKGALPVLRRFKDGIVYGTDTPGETQQSAAAGGGPAAPGAPLAGSTLNGESAPAAAPSDARIQGPKEEITVDLGNAQMVMVLIRPGSFMMGSDNGGADEKPVHKVTITKPFYIGKYEVTQDQWRAVMGRNPSCFKGAANPVEQVSWNDCQDFMKKLSDKVGGGAFRLPTEAEWEYACRAGSTTDYSFGDSESELGDYGWYLGNSGGMTHPVGQKKPNSWGLYDMHGNVWEWCSDSYGASYYAKGPADDPVGGNWGARVLRGGAWFYVASNCRSAYRSYHDPWYSYLIFGLRAVRNAE